MSGNTGSALDCLSEIARLRGVDISADRLRHDYVVEDAEPSLPLLLRMAQDIGLKARRIQCGWAQLEKLGAALPVMARLRNGNWVMIVEAGNLDGCPAVAIRDPLAADRSPMPVDRDRFSAAWSGELLLLKRDRDFGDDEEIKFGLAWFMPVILRYKHIFRDVGIAAIVFSFLGMAQPVFVQIIIDRVLVHHAIGTLKVIIVGMAGAIVFDTMFSYLRRYLMLYATNKIDAQISSKTVAKLISLPMDFFERASTGIITKNVQQTDRIRHFLTGQVFQVLLDCVGLVVMIPMLFFYSTQLAMIVLSSALVLAIMLLALIPPFKRRLTSLYNAEANLQGFLVENIQGMRTIKSLALDARQRQTWDRLLARAIDRRFSVANFSTVAASLIGPVDKVTQLLVWAVGASLIFDGQMMVGALIAFNIISGRVTGPLISLSQMVQQFQEVSLSIRMLATVMDHPAEQGRAGRGLRAPFQGTVQFDNVRFSYPGTSSPALDRVNFTIPSGSMVGVMGRSGSGKTTVTRLLQALHRPQEGMIRIDGHDLREIDLDHLRTNIGVVLQDNFLFRGSIRDNIASARPGATMDEVAEAARLAGADEFIEKLPRGFDTLLEEGSSNLSGGQRQRIAIARALLVNPPILILDEATSALDAESEAIVQASLMSIAKGRTLIIISHRLSSLVACDAIMCMDQGRIEDVGRHGELLGRCDVYRHLWHKQNRHLELAS